MSDLVDPYTLNDPFDYPAAMRRDAARIASLQRSLARYRRLCALSRGAVTVTGKDSAAVVTLNECPPGLFRFQGTLGFKSEYKSAGTSGGWQVDAYVVASGEYFWGGARSTLERGALLVTPICAEELLP